MSDRPVSRHTFFKGAGLGTAGVAFGAPAFLPRLGDAADDELRIGVIESNTGPYAAYAASEVKGIRMAVDHWNNHGGVDGRRVVATFEDDSNDPGVGVEKARKLIQQDQCVAIVGALNSAVALSVSSTTNTLGVPFINPGSHADDLTGKKCHYNTFRVCHSSWMESHATGFDLAERFGKKWYLIAPDFAYGHAMQAAYQDISQKIGGTIVGNDLVPQTTRDFSSYLTKMEAAKPDLLIVLVQGDQFSNLLQQAHAFGLTKKLPLGGPQLEMETVLSLPKEARVGYWGVEWYYNSRSCIGKPNNSGQWFVTNYQKRYSAPPTARGAFGYIAMDALLWGIKNAKSTDTIKVVRALEEAKFQSIFEGLTYFRKVDHQLMWPMWIGEIRENGTPEDPYDVINIVGRQHAADIEKTVEEKAQICHMDYP